MNKLSESIYRGIVYCAQKQFEESRKYEIEDIIRREHICPREAWKIVNLLLMAQARLN